MKLEISTEKLKKAVLKLKNSLPDVALTQITEHILFSIKDSVLTLKATNNQIAIIWITQIEKSDLDFSFTIQGETLCSLVSSFTQDKITFEFNPETKDITISCGKYVLEASSGAVSNYPVINIPEKLNEVKLPENFLDMLKSVYFSISNDGTKPDLNSMCIDLNKDSSEKISLMSTDRVRLSCANAKIDFDKDKTNRFIVPKSSVAEIIKLAPQYLLFSPEDSSVVYFKCENETGTYIFRSVLTNYAYPDIYAYLSNSFKEQHYVKANKTELINTLKRIRLTTDRTNKIGKLEFKKDNAIVSSFNSANKSKEEVTLTYESIENIPEDFNINIDYILEYLNQETENNINFKIVNKKCAIFDKDGYRHVLSINS